MRSSLRRVPILLGVLFLAAAIGVAVAAVAVGGDHGERLLEANDAMESNVLRQAVLVEAAPPADAVRFDRLSRAFDVALASGLVEAQRGSPERALLLA